MRSGLALPQKILLAAFATFMCAMLGAYVLERAGGPRLLKQRRRLGRFEVRTTAPEFTDRSALRDIYHVRGRSGKLVAKSVGSFVLDPGDSSRLLFEHCPDAPAERCGVYLFEGATRRSGRISDRATIPRQVLAMPWAPDGRSIALVRREGGEVLMLQTGYSLDLAAELHLEPPRRVISSAEWRPDGRLVMGVVEHLPTEGPFPNTRRQSYLVDPVSGGIAELRGR